MEPAETAQARGAQIAHKVITHYQVGALGPAELFAQLASFFADNRLDIPSTLDALPAAQRFALLQACGDRPLSLCALDDQPEVREAIAAWYERAMNKVIDRAHWS
jgi:hypothetical protein